MTRTPIAAIKASLTTGPMAVKGFPWLLAGQFTSSVGDMCFAIALPWLVLSSDGGPVLLGSVLACYGISRAAATPLGGVITDRFGARPVMMAADLARFALTAALAVLALTVPPSFPVLAPITLLLGVCSGLFVPASFALLPSFLPGEELTAGNSMSSVVTRLGSLLGPALGGVLITAVGPGPALFADAATFLVSAATLLALRRPETAVAEDPGDEAGRVSFRAVLTRGRFLQVTLVAAVVGNFVYIGASEVALPTLAHRDFGAGGYGTLLAGLSAGLIAGALLARLRVRRLRPAGLLVVLVLVMGVSVALVPFSGGLAGATACITLFSVANGWSGITIMTMLQLWAPRHLLARVMSVMLLAMSGTFPISVAVTGWGVERFGVTAFFPIAGLAMALAVVWAAAQPAFREVSLGDRYTGEPERHAGQAERTRPQVREPETVAHGAYPSPDETAGCDPDEGAGPSRGE
ncbi:MFS transporter [Sphaerisporangium melleum]|uniref:MFS transporter n=1 Tax=Sphaerisporangium melleum TaxID=321316 RepID=A0A917RFJ6_9ACTN|nr:MFS transporter [Sphaerisporangium melleum]GGL05271.1 MFS transporter [Sphaerisporangium melleum]GII73912.1 MFS transporter [Sphaerisporangium melleum]